MKSLKDLRDYQECKRSKYYLEDYLIFGFYLIVGILLLGMIYKMLF